MLKWVALALCVWFVCAQDNTVPEFPKGGPLAHVYDKLSAEQQKKLDALLADTANKPKKEVRDAIANFIKSLDKSDVTEHLKSDHSNFEQFKTKVKEQAKSLTPEGQDLFNKLVTIVENDRISFVEEHNQIKDLLDKTPESVLREFHEKKIPLPGAQAKINDHAVVQE